MTQIRFTASEKGAKLDMDGYKGRKCLKDAEEFLRLMKEFGVDLETENIEEKPEINIAEGTQVESKR